MTTAMFIITSNNKILQSLWSHSCLHLLWWWNNGGLMTAHSGRAKVRHQSSLCCNYCQSNNRGRGLSVWLHNDPFNDGLVSYKHSFSLHKMLIDGLESCGLLVDYCDVFISCLNSHSNGTHSLQMILWWASDVMQNFSKFIMKEQTHLHVGWPEGESVFSKFSFLGELFL